MDQNLFDEPMRSFGRMDEIVRSAIPGYGLAAFNPGYKIMRSLLPL